MFLPESKLPLNVIVEFGSDDDDDEGFPHSSVGKKSACNAGDPGSIPGLGWSPGEGIGYSLQYSGLENCMDSIVHGMAKSWTWLSDFHFHFHDDDDDDDDRVRHFTISLTPGSHLILTAKIKTRYFYIHLFFFRLRSCVYLFIWLCLVVETQGIVSRVGGTQDL